MNLEELIFRELGKGPRMVPSIVVAAIEEYENNEHLRNLGPFQLHRAIECHLIELSCGKRVEQQNGIWQLAKSIKTKPTQRHKP